MGKKKHDSPRVDRYFDPLGFDPLGFLNPMSSGSSGSGGSNSAGFEIGGRAIMKKGDYIGASALFRDLKLDSMFGKEFYSGFSLKGDGTFDLDITGTADGSRASSRGQYKGEKVKEMFSGFFAQGQEGKVEIQKKQKDGKEMEEYVIKPSRSESALAQGFVKMEKGEIDIWGSGSVDAGSGLRALKELGVRIRDESKGEAQAVAQISRSVEGREIMQRFGGASAGWQVSGGQLNIRKQVMMADG